MDRLPPDIELHLSNIASQDLNFLDNVTNSTEFSDYNMQPLQGNNSIIASLVESLPFSSTAIYSNDALPSDVEFFDDFSSILRTNNVLHQDLTFLDTLTYSSECSGCTTKQLHQNCFIPVQPISPNITDCNDVLRHEAEFLNHSPVVASLHMSNLASQKLNFLDNDIELSDDFPPVASLLMSNVASQDLRFLDNLTNSSTTVSNYFDTEVEPQSSTSVHNLVGAGLPITNHRHKCNV